MKKRKAIRKIRSGRRLNAKNVLTGSKVNLKQPLEVIAEDNQEYIDDDNMTISDDDPLNFTFGPKNNPSKKPRKKREKRIPIEINSKIYVYRHTKHVPEKSQNNENYQLFRVPYPISKDIQTDFMQCVGNTYIKNLANKANIFNLSGGCYEPTRDIIKNCAGAIIAKTLVHTQSAGRGTILLDDVKKSVDSFPDLF